MRLDVYRHAQDDWQSCGRAVAQSTIGYFAGLQTAGTGQAFTLPSQAAIRDRETNPNPSGGDWHTTPAELKTVLEDSALWTPTAGEWTVERNDDESLVLAVAEDILRRLGHPAAVTSEYADHWKLMTGVVVKGDKRVYTLMDPAPPEPRTHGVGDACHQKNVADLQFWNSLSLSRKTKGTFVIDGQQACAVVLGAAEPRRTEELVRSIREGFRRPGPQRLGDRENLAAVRSAWRSRLAEAAETFALAELGALLTARAALSLHHVRHVRDDRDPDAAVVVAAARTAGGAGLLAAFDRTPETALLRCRLAPDGRLPASFGRRPERELFWSPEWPGAEPFHPLYRAPSDGGGGIRRLYDDSPASG